MRPLTQARAGSKHRFFKKSGGAKGASFASSLASREAFPQRKSFTKTGADCAMLVWLPGKLFLNAKACWNRSLCSLPAEASERSE